MKTLSMVVACTALSFSFNVYAAQNLKYPADCKNKTLEAAAKKNGCYIEEGKGHKIVRKDGKKVTEIPNSVKDNNTCRAIIKELNSQC